MKKHLILSTLLLATLAQAVAVDAAPPRRGGPGGGGDRGSDNRGGENRGGGRFGNPGRGDDNNRRDHGPGRGGGDWRRDHDRRDDRRDHRDHRRDRRGPPVRIVPVPVYPSYPYPSYPSYPRYDEPANRYGESSLVFTDISRRTGGQWLRVRLQYADDIRHIQLSVRNGSVKVHEVIVTTTYGQRYTVRELTGNRTMYVGETAYSEGLSYLGGITTIDIRAESIGVLSSLRVGVSSDRGIPALSGSR